MQPIGTNFILRCCEEKEKLLFGRVQQEWFSTTEKDIYSFCLDYLRTNKELPEISTISAKFRQSFTSPVETADYLLKELKNRFIYTTISDRVPDILSDLKKDPSNSLERLKITLGSINTGSLSGKDIDYSEVASNRFTEYTKRVGTHGVSHLSMGDEILDSYFMGYRPGDLITFAAMSGVGKTWWILDLALSTERELLKRNDLGPALLISNEMNEVDVVERMDCINFKLNYAQFIRGELSRTDAMRYKKCLEEVENKGSKMHILYNCSKLSDLESKISQYRPSVVFLDGSYLMEPRMTQGWEKIVHITRNLKAIAKDSGVALVNTTQLKRGASKKEAGSSFDIQDEFAWGSSFIQDSDLAIKGMQSPDMQYRSEILLEVAKGRRLPAGVKIMWKRDVENAEYYYSPYNSDGADFKLY